MTVLDYLRENNIGINAPCGGNGTCGKCLVSVDDGEPVLACRTEYSRGMSVRVLNEPEQMTVLGVKERTNGSENNNNNISTYKEDSGRYGIAIDIGTTTIASAICDTGSGRIIAEETRINSNVSFGADVISRIKAGSEGHGEEMRVRLLEDIRAVVFGLCRGIKAIDIIALAGNTTMIHTLMDYDLTPLGKYPYIPKNKGIIKGVASDILNIKSNDMLEIENSQCVIFPNAAAFVGGDITSGLYHLLSERKMRKGTENVEISGLRACDTEKANKVIGFMDLGTNGEMALVTNDIIYAASSAAGPVFEGGGISCGIGSVTGAINHVKIEEVCDGRAKVSYSTIGNEVSVKGICGSGVIDCVAEIFRAGLCDDHGTFINEGMDIAIAKYPDRSSVFFTQDDMRQVQLAKAAISAGFEILCKEAGIAYKDIDTLYLAGGMGYSLEVASAVKIGLVPKELKDRIVSIGNSSLKGAIDFITSDIDKETSALDDIISRCRVIELAEDPEFQDKYIGHIDF